jgi:hypothetical protein
MTNHAHAEHPGAATVSVVGGKDSYEWNSPGGKATRIKGNGGRNELLLEGKMGRWAGQDR